MASPCVGSRYRQAPRNDAWWLSDIHIRQAQAPARPVIRDDASSSLPIRVFAARMSNSFCRFSQSLRGGAQRLAETERGISRNRGLLAGNPLDARARDAASLRRAHRPTIRAEREFLAKDFAGMHRRKLLGHVPILVSSNDSRQTRRPPGHRASRQSKSATGRSRGSDVSPYDTPRYFPKPATNAAALAIASAFAASLPGTSWRFSPGSSKSCVAPG